MGIALYGNINGYTYRPPQLNLLDSAKSQNSNPTTVSSAYPDMPAVEVNISEEGLKALHGSKLPGSADPFETAERIAYMSEHQPIESYESKFSQMIPSSYEMNERGEAVYVHHTNEESGVFREYAGAYKWAYGDIFDKIHEKEPDADIYIKSASTTKDHDYHFINNSKRLVISTDEMKLLQSKNPKDADKQEKLWLDIFDRINNSMK